jgi:hypothetical protein
VNTAGRFHRLGGRQRQILQFTAIEFGVIAVVNGDVRLPAASQKDHMLAALPLPARRTLASAGVFFIRS